MLNFTFYVFTSWLSPPLFRRISVIPFITTSVRVEILIINYTRLFSLISTEIAPFITTATSGSVNKNVSTTLWATVLFPHSLTYSLTQLLLVQVCLGTNSE